MINQRTISCTMVDSWQLAAWNPIGCPPQGVHTGHLRPRHRVMGTGPVARLPQSNSMCAPACQYRPAASFILPPYLYFAGLVPCGMSSGHRTCARALIPARFGLRLTYLASSTVGGLQARRFKEKARPRRTPADEPGKAAQASAGAGGAL